jgi:hypothetical protein
MMAQGRKTYITPEMRSLIGREFGWQQSFPISASDIRKWAIAVYYPERPPRLFWDEEYAKTTRHGGIVAPEDFNPFAWPVEPPTRIVGQTVDHPTDATEMRFGVKGPGLKFQLNGGQEVEYTGVRMRPGDVITAVSTINDYYEREGRLGLMLFTVTETKWTNQRGELVKVSRNILIRYGDPNDEHMGQGGSV